MAENSFSKSLKKSKSSKQLTVGSGDGSKGMTFSLSFSESIFKSLGLEVGSIRRIQGIGYDVLEFLGVGTTFDIFQNIHILYLQYGVLTSSGYGVLIFIPLWSLVSAGTDTPYLPSWIRRIGLQNRLHGLDLRGEIGGLEASLSAFIKELLNHSQSILVSTE
ncbi:hypothetical protein Tco_0832576 [Tanacetum coccineum]